MAGIKIEWSEEARSDLLDILDYYILRNGNAIYSKKLNSRIKKSIKLISKNPFLGMHTDNPPVRVLITSYYQIICEVFDKLILVIMVWDCGRDPVDYMIQTRKK